MTAKKSGRPADFLVRISKHVESRALQDIERFNAMAAEGQLGALRFEAFLIGLRAILERQDRARETGQDLVDARDRKGNAVADASHAAGDPDQQVQAPAPKEQPPSLSDTVTAAEPSVTDLDEDAPLVDAADAAKAARHQDVFSRMAKRGTVKTLPYVRPSVAA